MTVQFMIQTLFNDNYQLIDCLGCTVGFWGRNCSHKCNCEHDSVCDQFNGQCKCTKGYTGERCELNCPSDRYGINCSEPCRCKNGGKCHHISGECTCAPGFTGPLCGDVCPVGTHGESCKSKCKCQNEGECDPQTGNCRCTDGMYHLFFEQKYSFDVNFATILFLYLIHD